MEFFTCSTLILKQRWTRAILDRLSSHYTVKRSPSISLSFCHVCLFSARACIGSLSPLTSSASTSSLSQTHILSTSAGQVPDRYGTRQAMRLREKEQRRNVKERERDTEYKKSDHKGIRGWSKRKRQRWGLTMGHSALRWRGRVSSVSSSALCHYCWSKGGRTEHKDMDWPAGRSVPHTLTHTHTHFLPHMHM